MLRPTARACDVARFQQNKSRPALFVVAATTVAAEVATKIILAVVELGDVVLTLGGVVCIIIGSVIGVGGLIAVAVDKTLTAGRAATAARAAPDIVDPEIAGEIAIAAAAAPGCRLAATTGRLERGMRLAAPMPRHHPTDAIREQRPADHADCGSGSGSEKRAAGRRL